MNPHLAQSGHRADLAHGVFFGCSLVETLPADQVVPLWQAAQARAAVFLESASDRLIEIRLMMAMVVFLIQRDPNKWKEKRRKSFIRRQFSALSFRDNNGV